MRKNGLSDPLSFLLVKRNSASAAYSLLLIFAFIVLGIIVIVGVYEERKVYWDAELEDPRIVDQYGDADSSFSVTVFADTAGRLTLAIRGTKEAGDFVPTDFDIATHGVGYDPVRKAG